MSEVIISVQSVGIISNKYCRSVNKFHFTKSLTSFFKVYMWGQCHGQAIVSPTETPFKSVHEISAFFATPSVTFKPMVTETCSGPSLLDSLKLAFDDPATADLKFVANKKIIHVHKSILKIRFDKVYF
jgi:hypothetical protein